MDEPLLVARELTFSYRAHPVLRDATVDLRAHELVAVVGPNGSGKSTLCRLLAGLLTPQSGTVRLANMPLSHHAARERARLVAYLPQELRVPFDTSVLELVLLGRLAWQRGLALATQGDLNAARRALEFVGIAALADRMVGALSGGERRRAAIAMVVAQSARILVLDEPANALDLRHAWALLARLRTERATALVVVHDLALAASCFDRVAVISNGRVVAFDRPDVALTEANVAEAFGVSVHRIATADGRRVGFLPRG